MNATILSLLLSISLTSMLSWEEQQVVKSGDYAIFFAVDEYQYMNDLTKPIENAVKIADLLDKYYGFNVEVIRNPTITEIDQVLKRYQEHFASGTYPTDGQLLIYFSGHGVKAGENGYFMASDSKPSLPQRTALEYGYYQNEVIDKINCLHILVAIDACHSATFDPAYTSRAGREFGRPGEGEFQRVLENHKTYKTRCFWTSDAEGDKTPDNSSFAYHFLKGLGISNSSTGYVRSSALFAEHLERANPKPGGGSFGSDHINSCFLFFHNEDIPDFDKLIADAKAWKQAEELGTLAAFEAYKKKFPEGDFLGAADQRIAALNEQADIQTEKQDWEAAKAANTFKAYNEYVRKYPEGKFIEDAKAAKEKLLLRNMVPFHTDEFPVPEVVFIKGGTFEMGQPDPNINTYKLSANDEQPVHEVIISDFYLGKNKVTVEEYLAFCEATNTHWPEWLEKGNKYNVETGLDTVDFYDSNFYKMNGYSRQGAEKKPIVGISWYDAVAYSKWLSAQSGQNWRLPTEAEWEYAASITLKKRSNTSAPYNMNSGVSEWCNDWYGSDYYELCENQGVVTNPKGPSSGSYRVLRGCHFLAAGDECRIEGRYSDAVPDLKLFNIGFRLVLSH